MDSETALGFRQSISEENTICDEVPGICLLTAELGVTFLVSLTRTKMVMWPAAHYSTLRFLYRINLQIWF